MLTNNFRIRMASRVVKAVPIAVTKDGAKKKGISSDFLIKKVLKRVGEEVLQVHHS